MNRPSSSYSRQGPQVYRIRVQTDTIGSIISATTYFAAWSAEIAKGDLAGKILLGMALFLLRTLFIIKVSPLTGPHFALMINLLSWAGNPLDNRFCLLFSVFGLSPNLWNGWDLISRLYVGPVGTGYFFFQFEYRYESINGAQKSAGAILLVLPHAFCYPCHKSQVSRFHRTLPIKHPWRNEYRVA